jgi:hypothetical protein
MKNWAFFFNSQHKIHVVKEEEVKSGYVQQTFQAGVTAAAHSVSCNSVALFSVPEADSAA